MSRDMELTRKGLEIIFIWVPGHFSIRGNSAADSAAKDALDGDISDELIPFSDLKSRVTKHWCIRALAVGVGWVPWKQTA